MVVLVNLQIRGCCNNKAISRYVVTRHEFNDVSDNEIPNVNSLD
jgi:hypothetical protein